MRYECDDVFSEFSHIEKEMLQFSAKYSKCRGNLICGNAAGLYHEEARQFVIFTLVQSLLVGWKELFEKR